MQEQELARYELIGRTLMWLAAAVFLLSVIGALVIATSDTTIPFAEDAERQGRGIFALVSIGGGIATGGTLAGLGAIVLMMVADRRERMRIGEPAATQALRDLAVTDTAAAQALHDLAKDDEARE